MDSIFDGIFIVAVAVAAFAYVMMQLEDRRRGSD